MQVLTIKLETISALRYVSTCSALIQYLFCKSFVKIGTFLHSFRHISGCLSCGNCLADFYLCRLTWLDTPTTQSSPLTFILAVGKRSEKSQMLESVDPDQPLGLPQATYQNTNYSVDSNAPRAFRADFCASVKPLTSVIFLRKVGVLSTFASPNPLQHPKLKWFHLDCHLREFDRPSQESASRPNSNVPANSEYNFPVTRFQSLMV